MPHIITNDAADATFPAESLLNGTARNSPPEAGDAALNAPALEPGTAPLVATLFALVAVGANGEAPEQQPTQPSPAVEKLREEDFAKPMRPPDPFNRGTPRGSIYGFALACRTSDYARAAEYLDLRRLPPEERERRPELAQQLRVALGRVVSADFTAFASHQLRDRQSRWA